MKGYRYRVNVHERKSQSIQGNTKQWNNAFIVVLHLEVTMRPSTKSKVLILVLWQYNKLHNFILLSYLFALTHPHPQHHNGTKHKILGLPINSGLSLDSYEGFSNFCVAKH